MRAAAINPLDFTIQKGNLRLLLPYRLPTTQGHGLAGVVTAVASRCTALPCAMPCLAAYVMGASAPLPST